MLGIIVFVVLTAQQARSTDPVLDMRGRDMTCGTGTGVVLGNDTNVAGAPRPSTTWRTTLRSVDKEAYRPGEEVVYEVEIMNVSATEQWIPWSTDPAFCGSTTQDGAAVVRITIDAALRGASLREPLGLLAGGVTMAGSRGTVGSMLRVESGRSAIIRARGRWSVLSPNVPIPDVAGVAGRIRVERLGSVETVVSQNTIIARTLR